MMAERSRMPVVWYVVVLVLSGWAGLWCGRAWGTPPTIQVCQACENQSPNGALFSGTRATAKATFTSHTYPIKKEEIWVNDTRRFIWEPNCNAAPSKVCVPYSTTAWADGTTLTVTAKCWTRERTEPFVATNSVPQAWNKSYSMGRVDFAYGAYLAEEAYTWCVLMNHCGIWSVSDPASTIVGQDGAWGGRLLNPTVAYFGTHGCSFPDDGCPGCGFVDCRPERNAVPECSVASATGAKQAAGVPHFNFVFVDACGSSESDWLYNAFKTTAYMGWAGDCGDTEEYARWTDALWHGFHEMWPYYTAIYFAYEYEPNVSNGMPMGDLLYRVHLVYPSV